MADQGHQMRLLIKDAGAFCPYCGHFIPFQGDLEIKQTAQVRCKNESCGKSVFIHLHLQVVDVLYIENNAAALVMQSEIAKNMKKDMLKEAAENKGIDAEIEADAQVRG